MCEPRPSVDAWIESECELRCERGSRCVNGDAGEYGRASGKSRLKFSQQKRFFVTIWHKN